MNEAIQQQQIGNVRLFFIILRDILMANGFKNPFDTIPGAMVLSVDIISLYAK